MVDELGETHVLVPATTVSELRAEVARLRAAIREWRLAEKNDMRTANMADIDRRHKAEEALTKIALED